MTLAVSDVREHVSTSLVDAAISDLLGAAYAGIERRVGADGASVTSSHGSTRGPVLMLARRATSITTVVERADTSASVTLAANDYRLRPSGSLVERLTTGDNPALYWRGRVDITYAPAEPSTAHRDQVALDYVKAAVDYRPGVSSERIGDWSQSYTPDQAMVLEAILDTILDPVVAR